VKTKQQILVSIKSQVQQVLPDAEIVLFGSRANGLFTEESDWDILILSDKPVTKKINKPYMIKYFLSAFPLVHL